MLLLAATQSLLNASSDEQLTTSLVVFLVGIPETLLLGPDVGQAYGSGSGSESPGFTGENTHLVHPLLLTVYVARRWRRGVTEWDIKQT